MCQCVELTCRGHHCWIKKNVLVTHSIITLTQVLLPPEFVEIRCINPGILLSTIANLRHISFAN